MKKYALPFIMLLFFILIAVTLWITQNNLFYLFNFTYIGCFVFLGLFLFVRKNPYARRVTQLGVGLYMLVYLGLISRENMQIEGFWYYLFSGVFQSAVIHYLVAKIAGPLLFGRGWCGYACWTAMVLDFLPYKIPQTLRIKKLSLIRYILFILSFLFVAALFLLNIAHVEQIMFISFIAGNILYYVVGVSLAFILKDNRAFCKYICPITVFLKPMSYFSLTRVKVDKKICVSCKKCLSACPMNVDLLDDKRSRRNGTECIWCMSCANSCPRHAVHF